MFYEVMMGLFSVVVVATASIYAAQGLQEVIVRHRRTRLAISRTEAAAADICRLLSQRSRNIRYR